jgi:PAS domain S-box-containing protein
MSEDSSHLRGADRAPLDESAQKYRALFEQSLDGIFLHDLDGQIVDVNHAAVAQSGFSKEELVGMTVFDLIAGDMPRDEITDQWRSWAPGEAVIIEGRHRRNDGTDHPVEINTGKVVIGARELMLAIVRDISERLRAEEERAKLEQQLRHAQKMEAVGRLAGGMAHDFNNVLCSIVGHADLALLPGRDERARRESVNAIRLAAERASTLTQQLLAFSRRQLSEPKVLDLGEITTSLQPMLARLLGEDVVLRTLQADTSCCVRVDPSLMEQVLLNLAINARDAMPSGGQLVVETAAVDLDASYCAGHADASPGPCVMLAVSDTGSGMDEDTRAKIFEPFFTTKEHGKGTGLGLATVYGIVQQAGGRIEVYSEPGQGTSFKIYLPRVLSPTDPAQPRSRREPPRGTETVLLVEDEAMVRDVAAQLLGLCGYRVLPAADPAEALALAAEREQESIDLLLTDVVLPGMNGQELAARLRAARPGLRVLYASGYPEGVIGGGVLEPEVHFVAKPYSMDALATHVRAALDAPPSRHTDR